MGRTWTRFKETLYHWEMGWRWGEHFGLIVTNTWRSNWKRKKCAGEVTWGKSNWPNWKRQRRRSWWSGRFCRFHVRLLLNLWIYSEYGKRENSQNCTTAEFPKRPPRIAHTKPFVDMKPSRVYVIPGEIAQTNRVTGECTTWIHNSWRWRGRTIVWLCCCVREHVIQVAIIGRERAKGEFERN